MRPVVTYRAGDAGDLEIISRFVLNVCERDLFPLFEVPGRETLRAIYALDSLQAQFEAGGSFFLAEVEGEVVGAVASRLPAHVFLLYVDAPYRGLGLGASLLHRMTMLNAEAKHITLNANLDAVTFYETLGFRADGPERVEQGLRFLPMVLEPRLNRAGHGP